MTEITPATLKSRLEALKSTLNIDAKQARLGELERELAAEDVWQAPERAGRLAQEQKRLSEQVEGTVGLTAMLEAASASDMPELMAELDRLENIALLSGEHDAAAAVLSLYAGAGGTDAQDWAEMLLRMYLRLAERRGWRATLVDESRGEEAGLKKAVLTIEGQEVFGWLKGEAGVHRLVRQSPFNAKSLRQTSFALVDVLPEVKAAASEAIKPDELRIDVFRASGKGGQGVNTTDSAVRITHLATGIVVTCQNERSQLQNKATAMTILESKLARLREVRSEEERAALRGEIPQAAWGNQIRNYVLHPYQLVKDLRTGIETADTTAILNGELDEFLQAQLRLGIDEV